jgi:hypothetical protein
VQYFENQGINLVTDKRVTKMSHRIQKRSLLTSHSRPFSGGPGAFVGVLKGVYSFSTRLVATLEIIRDICA